MRKERGKKRKDGRKVPAEVEVQAEVTVEIDEGTQRAETGGHDHGLERRRPDIHLGLDLGKDEGRSTEDPGHDLEDLGVGQEADQEGQGQDLTNVNEARGQKVDLVLEAKILRKITGMDHIPLYQQHLL